jgi:hypothetical protein
MRPRRSALPLPRYVRRKPLIAGWGYFFDLPGWARATGCPVQNEPLGTDYEEAVKRAETILLPAFDAWRGGETTAEQDGPATQGTLDWMFSQYREPIAGSRSFPPGRGAIRRATSASSAVT